MFQGYLTKIGFLCLVIYTQNKLCLSELKQYANGTFENKNENIILMYDEQIENLLEC